eukprot:UN08618
MMKKFLYVNTDSRKTKVVVKTHEICIAHQLEKDYPTAKFVNIIRPGIGPVESFAMLNHSLVEMIMPSTIHVPYSEYVWMAFIVQYAYRFRENDFYGEYSKSKRL